ncbi:DNA polymerase I [SAR202 cluster bacterium AD-804-J14_MRT_500m]|nr:DNA polymerase I [SAR202 cluster bacterium AD-804-J14_MRT_500m]
MVGTGQHQLSLPEERQGPLLIIMDGHAMIHRAYHAIAARQNLTNSSGEDTTAVLGFSNTFLRSIERLRPTHCIMAFDTHGPTFRHDRYLEYKAHRLATPPELRHQFDRVKQLMAAFNVPVLEAQGYEADDVLGTLANQAEGQNIETIILTGDTDTLQLVSPHVKVLLSYSVQEQKLFDEQAVLDRYGGLTPSQQPDFKAIKGDSSDNIPGVPGVGEKTAIKLLSEFGTLEGVYDNLEEVTPPRAKKAFSENKDLVFESRFLTTISREAPVKLDMDECKFWDYERSDVVNFMRDLEFLNVIPRVPEGRVTSTDIKGMSDRTESGSSMSNDYRLVNTEEGLKALVEALWESGRFSFDTETTDLNSMKARLVGLSFSISPGTAWYVPVGHLEGRQISLDDVLSDLRPLMEDPNVLKTGHNLNYDVMVLANHNVKVQGIYFDTMMAAHILGRKGIGLKNLAVDVLNQEMTPISALIGVGKKAKTFDHVSIEDAVSYACADADFTLRLQGIFEESLREQGFWDLFQKVEMPLVDVLVKMQRHGIALDIRVLSDMAVELKEQIGQLKELIYNDVGHEFTINSPQQLSDVLFNQLGLPKTRRTKTGYSTDANALEGLRGAHPVVQEVLDYRQVAKLKSTYVDSLPSLVNPESDRIHTSYNQSGSATGRMSSNDPNLQNIPVRTELGRQVRKAFTAQKTNEGQWSLLSADYSQIELRVLAHLSEDSGLVDAFLNGEDIHSSTAAMMFEVPIEKVTPDHRRIAKVLNFGVIYGLSAYGIAQQTEFSPDDGRHFIETYFAKYPGIQEYIKETKAAVSRNGYVETLLGRRRYIPEIESSNVNVRQAGERMAINMPVQGTAADIMKLAMIRVHRRIEESGLQSKMLLQVHDELMFEASDDEFAIVQDIALEEMANALHGFAEMIVPLKVDVKSGYNWGDMR